jgi:uncharacterized protein (TIGR02145 family)
MVIKKLIILIFLSASFVLQTCKKLEKEMLVATGDVTNILTNSADVSGQIIDLGKGVVQHGHCYSQTANASVSDLVTELGIPVGTGGFTSQLTNLEAGVHYYIKAYISDGIKPVYGKEISFSTIAPSIPTISTAAITSLTANSAITGGNISSDGGASVTARGVCWSTSINPATTNSKTSDATGTGSFVSTVNGLNPGISYYVRAYAINSVGTAYGDEISFSTIAGVPILTTKAITTVTAVTASSGGNISSDGGASVTSRGVCWSTSQHPSVNDNKTTDGSGNGIFTSSLTGLQACTLYYLRAYATNQYGTAYGDEIMFTSMGLPTLSTISITGITNTSAISGGNVANECGSPVTVRGVCWNTSPNPTVTDNHTSDGNGTGSFISNLTGLTLGTTYYVRAYASNSVGTAYGDNELFFKTVPVIPVLSTNTVTVITTNTATSGGNITNDGGATVTSRGVCWSTTSNPTTVNSKTSDGPGSGSFISNLIGLNAGTTYYVRAYATNNAGTAYGNQQSFITVTSTAVIPILTTTSVTLITATTASSGGKITSDGGASVTTRGVCWSTNQNPAVTDNHTEESSGTGTFISSLTGLIPGTTYFVRAFATNNAGTAYGNELSFKTISVVPSVTTAAVTLIAAYTASSGGNITFDGGEPVTARGVCWSTSHDPTVADGHSNDGSGTGSFISSLTGLISGTIYYVRAYATNSVGTAYGDEVSFKTSPGVPILTTATITSITASTSSSGGNITYDGGAEVTARGVCWSTSQNPTITDNHTDDGSVAGSFTSNLTGLKAATIYYVRAYATNSAGTSYGNQVSFVSSLTVTHTAGVVAPVTKTVTYGIVETSLSGEKKCWITQNLGADNQANSANDTTETAAGWYWEFNRKQGNTHLGSTCIPPLYGNYTAENSDWTAANDPCSILLGTYWRIPTKTEWTNVINNIGGINYNHAYASVLKLHAAGRLSPMFQQCYPGDRGSVGYFWCTEQYSDTRGWTMFIINAVNSLMDNGKGERLSIRCLRD